MLEQAQRPGRPMEQNGAHKEPQSARRSIPPSGQRIWGSSPLSPARGSSFSYAILRRLAGPTAGKPLSNSEVCSALDLPRLFRKLFRPTPPPCEAPPGPPADLPGADPLRRSPSSRGCCSWRPSPPTIVVKRRLLVRFWACIFSGSLQNIYIKDYNPANLSTETPLRLTAPCRSVGWWAVPPWARHAWRRTC